MDIRKKDEDFIKSLRLQIGYSSFEFGSDKEHKANVPKELTHEYLFENKKITKSIDEYYHKRTQRLLSNAEFLEMKQSGFGGAKETALFPYSIKIFGAYHCRAELVLKLQSILYGTKRINNKVVKSFTDLVPYFKEYARGFEDGFKEFEKIQVKPFFPMFPDKQDYLQRVFEFITQQIWGRGLTTDSLNNNEIIDGFEGGQRQGYLYKAWSIVFASPYLFEPLFKDVIKNKKPQQADQSKQGNNKADKPITSDLKSLFKDADKYTEVMQIPVFASPYLFEPLFKDFIKSKKPQQTDQPQQGNSKAKKPIISDLESLFKDADKYTEVMQILAKYGYIYEETGFWTDEKNGTKGFLASLIKHLYTKEYLKQKPKNEEIKLICKNTFGAELSTRTIAGAKQNSFSFAFIPTNGT